MARRLRLVCGAALFVLTSWFVLDVVGSWVHARLPSDGGLGQVAVRDCLAHTDGETPSRTPCGEGDARYVVSAAVTDPLHCYRIEGSRAILRVDRGVLCLSDGPAAQDGPVPVSVAGVRAGFCRAEDTTGRWTPTCSGPHRRALAAFRTEDTGTDPLRQCQARGAAATELAESTVLRDLGSPGGTTLGHVHVVCVGPTLPG